MILIIRPLRNHRPTRNPNRSQTMLSNLIAIIWVSYENRRHPLIVLCLAAILINKAVYELIFNTWLVWIFTEYIGFALLLCIAFLLVKERGHSIVPVVVGMAIHAMIFALPYIIGFQPFSWYLRFECAHIGLYFACVFSLIKIPHPPVSGIVRKLIAEPLHVLVLYCGLLAIADISGMIVGGKFERYMFHQVDTNLFIGMLLLWAIGIYYRRDRGYVNETN
jgi:hypothetical protein